MQAIEQQTGEESGDGQYPQENHYLLSAVMQNVLEESAMPTNEAALRVIEHVRQSEVEARCIEQQEERHGCQR
ncbi:hypothetical protein D9M71_842670 [compost metagenome]